MPDSKRLTACLVANRPAQTAADRELLKKHAGMFNEQTSIEARLVPEIEWRAEGD